MITSFNNMPWVIRDSKSIRMMCLHKDALKMCRIARRFADEEIESKMDKLKSLVSKAIEWLRNKGRIIVQANPVLTYILKNLIMLKTAIQMWSGAFNVGHAVVRASVFAKAAREYNLTASQFLSQIPPEARPISILLKGIKLLLISIIKIIAVREISKMQSEKIQDAGVKGMKKGQHIKARNPEYVESLKGGGGASSGGASSSQPQKQGMSTGKKIAIGLGALAGGAALAFGGHKLMKLAGAKKAAQKALPAAAQKVSSAAAPAAKAISSASSNVKNVTSQGKNIAKKLGGSAAARNVGGVHAQRAAMAKARQIASTASHSAGTHTGVINRMANSTKNMQRALANPNHVFDI